MMRVLFLLWQLSEHQSRCYFCKKVPAAQAIYSDVCVRHQLLLTLKLLWMVFYRQRRFKSLMQLWRWWE